MKHIRKLTNKNGFKYRVRFCVNYKEITIGTFDTEEKAIIKRDKAYFKYGIVQQQKEMTQEYLKSLTHYNASTGEFTRLHRSGNGKIGTTIGTKNGKGYLELWFFNKCYKAHRMAFLYMLGYIPDVIDHDDRNKANNKWNNIFESTNKENSRNCKRRIDNKWGITGVTKTPTGWKAVIQDDNKEAKLLYYGPDFFETCCKRKAAERYYNYHINHGRK